MQIHELEKELGKTHVPPVQVGDTVEVHYLIREGEKERVQLFIGTVIQIKGRGIRKSVTVRRIVQGEGVERTFPLHNPRVQDVVTTRRGEVRRSRLFYLRDRVGKATRLKELLGEKGMASAIAARKAQEAEIKAAEEAAAAASADQAEEPAGEEPVEVEA
jgi:large subunit ribosomal protein L19